MLIILTFYGLNGKLNERKKPNSCPWPDELGGSETNNNLGGVIMSLTYCSTYHVPVRAGNGRIVGILEGEVLKKKVRRSVHLLRQPRGWAWDVSILEEAEEHGALYTELIDEESTKIYWAPLSEFQSHGVSIDRGFGKQIVLPLAYWQVTRQGAPRVEQLSLWQ